MAPRRVNFRAEPYPVPKKPAYMFNAYKNKHEPPGFVIRNGVHTPPDEGSPKPLTPLPISPPVSVEDMLAAPTIIHVEMIGGYIGEIGITNELHEQKLRELQEDHEDELEELRKGHATEVIALKRKLDYEVSARKKLQGRWEKELTAAKEKDVAYACLWAELSEAKDFYEEHRREQTLHLQEEPRAPIYICNFCGYKAIQNAGCRDCATLRQELEAITRLQKYTSASKKEAEAQVARLLEETKKKDAENKQIWAYITDREEALGKMLNKAQAELADARTEVNDLKASAENDFAQMAWSRRRIVELQDARNELETDVESLREENSRLMKEKANLKETLATNEKRSAVVQTEITQLTTLVIDHLQGMTSGSDDQLIQAMSKQLKAMLHDNANLLEVYQQQTLQLQDLHTQLEDANADLSTLRASLTAQTAELATLATENNILDTRLLATETDHGAALAQIDNLAPLAALVPDLRSTITHLRSLLASAAPSDFEEVIRLQEEEIRAAEARAEANAEAAGRVREWEMQVGGWRKEMERLGLELRHADFVREELEGEVGRLRGLVEEREGRDKGTEEEGGSGRDREYREMMGRKIDREQRKVAGWMGVPYEPEPERSMEDF